MSELAIVRLEPVRWRVAQCAELWLPDLEDGLQDFRGLSREIARGIKRGLEILLMAGSKANYLEDKVAAEVLGATAFTAPSPIYFGLWTTAGSLTDAFDGSTANETTYGSYARVSVTNNTTNFSGTTSPRTNTTAITFPQSTSGSQTVNQVGVLDGNAGTSADHGLLWADLTAARTIDSGETPEFAASAFSYSED